MGSIMSWEKDPMLNCDNETCGFQTESPKEAIAHAYETAHSISGPGAIEGTTLTVSLVRDEEDDEDSGTIEVPTEDGGTVEVVPYGNRGLIVPGTAKPPKEEP